ncbi:uncharacterized protein LOC142354389 [Convolutriloba macropyga]|uniref:uncharacterized protein LOC142354389 n=1 Tax=Convolutriloba macropyga TaxID=536237 RepID=UPI003F51DB6E
MRGLLFIALFISVVSENYSLRHIPSQTSHHHLFQQSEQLKKPSISLIINGVKTKNPRPFFARIKTGSTFCGATILNWQFLLTATSCVSHFFFFRPETISVEIGDFTDPESKRTEYAILDYFITPDYGLRDYPENNLALVKLTTSIPNWKSLTLPICSYDATWEEMCETTIAACGMGSVSTQRNSTLLPVNLMETWFRQTMFEAVNTKEIVFCKNHTICTVPIIDGGSICNMDEGGPLYKVSYGSPSTRTPVCLFGIATYHTSVSGQGGEICNGGSYFASIMYYKEWIEYTVTINAV